jgi:hypothetical protein
MTWLLRCECGVELSGLTENDLVLAAEGHITAQHPALGAPPARADLLAMAEEVEDVDA